MVNLYLKTERVHSYPFTLPGRKSHSHLLSGSLSNPQKGSAFVPFGVNPSVVWDEQTSHYSGKDLAGTLFIGIHTCLSGLEKTKLISPHIASCFFCCCGSDGGFFCFVLFSEQKKVGEIQ